MNRLTSSARGACVLAALALLLATLGMATACGAPSPVPAHTGPIVLITCEGLRADAVGALAGDAEASATPKLDSWARQASWAGRAVATSSAPAPALASLFTGLSPWQHQVLYGSRPPAEELWTLAEALHQQGYATTAFVAGRWLLRDPGWRQGFDRFQRLQRDQPAVQFLAHLDGSPQLVWIHLDQPQPPYQVRPRFAQLLRRPPRTLPARMTALDLAAFRDPARPLPPARRAAAWELYRQNVAWLDARVGQLLEALTTSGQSERALVVFTSLHGEEFGEQGQVGHGQNLSRVTLEVPLIVQVPPDDAQLKAALPAQPWPSQLALWPMLVAATGGAVPAAVIPDPAGGAPSELYLTNGSNYISLLAEGGTQLLREVPFAPPEADYYRARRRKMGGRGELREPPKRIFGRLQRAFMTTLPFSGGKQPARLSLWRWTENGVEAVDDAEQQERLAQDMDRRWHAFLERERTPAEEARWWP